MTCAVWLVGMVGDVSDCWHTNNKVALVSTVDRRRPAPVFPERHLGRLHFRWRVRRRPVQRESLLDGLGRTVLLRRRGADARCWTSRWTGGARRRRTTASAVRSRRGPDRARVFLLRRRSTAAASGQLQRVRPARFRWRRILLTVANRCHQSYCRVVRPFVCVLAVFLKRLLVLRKSSVPVSATSECAKHMSRTPLTMPRHLDGRLRTVAKLRPLMTAALS